VKNGFFTIPARGYAAAVLFCVCVSLIVEAALSGLKILGALSDGAERKGDQLETEIQTQQIAGARGAAIGDCR
jgi:hypothetical protein